MSDDDSGDRLLNLFGIALALFLVAGLVTVVLAGIGGPTEDVDDAPDAEWSLERVNDSHIRLVHRGGDSIPASDLVVTVDGVRRRVSWDGVVQEGESGTVRAGNDVLVQLYWTTDRGERVKLREWPAA
jgi:hypothetical protein